MTGSIIAHTSAGTGPPVLLLNGGFMTMMAWQGIAAPLEAEYQVIRCDFRGQLLSPGKAHATLEGHVDDVIAVLDALAVDSTHVIGTSFGAFVGIVMAARRPERVRSLVAATATDRITREDWEAAQPVVAACSAAAHGSGDGGLVLELLAPATYSAGYLEANKGVMQQRRAFLSSMPQSYFAGHSGILEVMKGLDLRPYAAAIRCSTLVLAAEDDRTFPLERSRSLAAYIPSASLEIIRGAPHGAFIEMPQTVLPSLQAFLRRVTAGPVMG